ncbi:MAG TPA: bifunctional phosphoglucose/phosphomannose isomerase [Crocinitomix sp.]|nr:bifunctional phosphoglucose/phosphomannose isomerase [Crocinitomix sp.]
MKTLVANFANQLMDAKQIGESISFIPTNKNFSNVLICGLGGSGIGGKIISLLVREEAKIPIVTTNDYSIPNFVNKNTLVIANSYSGNTEETLTAVKESDKRGAEIVAITSGGALLEMAKLNKWNHFVVPSGEQPRAMLAYSLIQLLFTLEKHKIVSTNYTSQLQSIANLVTENESQIKKEALKVAKQIYQKKAVIYADQSFEGVAVRFRQQINENAKELCWHHVLPEMNHNELVGWAGGDNNIAVIKLNSSFEFYRTKKRWEICKSIISEKTDTIIEINAKGNNKLAQVLYLIHITDWISVLLADLKQVDAVEVDVIIKLKDELSKLG